MVVECVAFQKATPTEISMDLVSGVGFGGRRRKVLAQHSEGACIPGTYEKRCYEAEGAILT